MPGPTKKPLGSRPLPTRPGPAADDNEENQGASAAPARSRADAFNNATAETGFGLPVGSYTCHLVGADREVEGKKESVKFTYQVYDGEFESKEVPAYYNLFDKDGNPSKGIGFLKRDMAILQQPELDYDQLDDQMEALAAERILVNITVKKNGQWTNIYLAGLADTQ